MATGENKVRKQLALTKVDMWEHGFEGLQDFDIQTKDSGVFKMHSLFYHQINK